MLKYYNGICYYAVKTGEREYTTFPNKKDKAIAFAKEIGADCYYLYFNLRDVGRRKTRPIPVN